ncbi:MAG: polymerase, sigma-24 subunit, subfamily [Frankiales bacterium]|nr:polymerase, sigma-24 subunit, subfamily [Frankiales bacterium]
MPLVTRQALATCIAVGSLAAGIALMSPSTAGASARSNPRPTVTVTATAPTVTVTAPAVTVTARSSETPAASSSAASAATTAGRVVARINAVRAQNGLPPLSVLTDLNAGSRRHNVTMASDCGLSHQCPGEPPFGDRITAAGVRWSAAGENVGSGGPVSDGAGSASMALRLTDMMFVEVAPNDGHRRNLLSSTFHNIGVDVHVDSRGTVWMTQDFTN